MVRSWSLLIRFDFHSFGDVWPAGDEYRTKENRIIFLFSEGHARARTTKKLDSNENPSPFLTRIFTDTRSRADISVGTRKKLVAFAFAPMSLPTFPSCDSLPPPCSSRHIRCKLLSDKPEGTQVTCTLFIFPDWSTIFTVVSRESFSFCQIVGQGVPC